MSLYQNSKVMVNIETHKLEMEGLFETRAIWLARAKRPCRKCGIKWKETGEEGKDQLCTHGKDSSTWWFPILAILSLMLECRTVKRFNGLLMFSSRYSAQFWFIWLINVQVCSHRFVIDTLLVYLCQNLFDNIARNRLIYPEKRST